MAKINKKCIICGSEYSYCTKCGKDAKKPTWMNLFDVENCKNIYTTCTEYRDGVISADEAKEKIAKCDLSKLNNFAESAKKIISLIKKEEVEVKEKKLFKKED